MSKNILYLFPDTNFFIHYKNPNELSWTDIGEFEEIRLIITMPVLTEIDELKYGNKNRVQKRARQYTSQFKKINRSENAELKVSDSPSVILKINLTLERDHELLNEIGSENQDNILASIANKYANENSDKDVRLLTGDVVLSLKAREHSIPCIFIPDSWRRENEKSKAEKKIEELELKIKILESSEPKFEFNFVDTSGTKAEKIELKKTVYQPLSEEETGRLLDEVKRRYPKCDFGANDMTKCIIVKDGKRFKMIETVPTFLIGNEYIPPSNRKVEEYGVRYDEWIEKCSRTFRNLWEQLNSGGHKVSVAFEISNVGQRPGENVRVTFSANGKFLLAKVPKRDMGETVAQKRALAPPSPPEPPRGEWKTHLSEVQSSVDEMEGVGSDISNVMPTYERQWEDHALPIRDIKPLIYHTHDPEKKRWQVGSLIKYEKEVELTCEKWRHDGKKTTHHISIIFPTADEEINGSIEVTIHADNISSSHKVTVPLDASVGKISSFDEALKLIDEIGKLDDIGNIDE